MKIVLAFVLAFSGSLIAAPETKPTIRLADVPGFDLKPNGIFQIDGLRFSVAHFDANWETIRQNQMKVDEGFPRLDGSVWETSGTMVAKGGADPISLQQKITPAGERAFEGDWQVSHSKDLATREVSLSVEIPVADFAGRVIEVDDTAYPLPAQFGKLNVLDVPEGSHTLVLPASHGAIIIEGQFSILAQDNRKWGANVYNARIRFSPARKDLKLSIRFEPYAPETVSLRGVANRGFADTVPGDGTGGWTDQGAENDLACLKPGPLNANDVAFDIVDPATNDGRGALVFGRTGHDDLPLNATLPITSPQSKAPVWRNLYLLHAAAWPVPGGKPAGYITAKYVDGTESRITVVSGRDISNWFPPTPCANATIGWTDRNASLPVALYLSSFALEPKPLASLVFEGTGKSMWMIAGVSGSERAIPIGEPLLPLTITANKDWAAYPHSLDIEPEGIFDFSALTDAPAGKHGPLTATADGHFAFQDQPDQHVRFWGVNLCFSANFLEKAAADTLAERLVRSGYNVVRFHHIDSTLVRKGGLSHELDEQQLDKLDYLFAALKKRGIYLNTDLFSGRRFHPDELKSFGIEKSDSNTKYIFNGLLPLSEPAFAAWSAYARALLTHKNPYTGLSWAEDPALIGICPVNEDSIYARVDYPALRPLYTAAFEKSRQAPEGETEAARQAAFNQFIYETQIRSDARNVAFISSLGTKALITGTNHRDSEGLAFVRARQDYVDNHQYWDHPRFPINPWKAPYAFNQKSATAEAAFLPRLIMPTRIFGKPFSITEFNYVRPNRYRAEGSILMAAYASLQDWDAIYNFQYAENSETAFAGGAENYFALASDPIGLIGDRVSALLFRRQDIAPARGSVSYAVRPAEAYAARGQLFPEAFNKLGLITRIGSNPGEPSEVLQAHPGLSAVVVGETPPAPSLPKVYTANDELIDKLERDGVIPAGSRTDLGKKFISDTGEIELQTENATVKVITPRCELFLLSAGKRLDGKLISVTNGGIGSNVSVIAMDGKPLEQSARILVTHLTDALPTGTHFAHQDRKLLEKWGQLPHLVARGEASLRMQLSAGDWKAWAVDSTGKRIREIPLTNENGVWGMEISTITEQGSQLAYELARS